MIGLRAAHQCAIHTIDAHHGLVLAILVGLSLIYLAIGALGHFAPRHWLIANLTSFRDIDTRGRKEVREALGIEDRIRSAGI